MKTVIYHPEASAEFDAAAERYESLAVGLGNSFIDEVEAIVARIEELPSQFPICSFEYTADTAPVPATVAEHIDAALGISTAAPRALLGNIDVAWRDESRLDSIELRTGRGQWQPASLRTPTDSLEASSMTFGLDYDINGVASVDLEFAVLWDATRSRLALRFDTADPAKVRWVAIADTVFVCVDSEQSLIEIQFDSVAIVAADLLT